MINPLDLTGKHILVTGASSGIGRDCAVLVSQLGASVTLVARNQSRLQQTINLLSGKNHLSVSFELTDFTRFEELFQQITETNKIDGIVHAAGICPVLPLQTLTIPILQQVLEINYLAFVQLAKFFAKKKFSNGGSLVGLSSVSSQTGWVGGIAYCGSKGALEASTRSLALELAPKKIRVNCIMPSNIRTSMLENMMSVTDEKGEERILSKQPLGIGEPRDVANAVAFLLSDAAKFITGTSLVVDGGYLAQ